MSEFKRSYLITLTTLPVPEKARGIPYLDTLADENKRNPRLVDIFNITEIRITATVITTTTNSNSQYTEIRLFNASKETINKVNLPNTYITLAAGYKYNLDTGATTKPEDLPNIFAGEIVDAFTKKEGSDYVTTIRAKDAELAKRDSYISHTYVGLRTIDYILEDIVTRFFKGVSVGRIKLVEDFASITTKNTKYKTVLSNAYTAYGKVEDVLDDLKKDFNFEWYILGGEFYAQPKNFGRAREYVTIRPRDVINDLQPATGTNNTTTPSDVNSGLQAQLFLNGRVTPTKYIKVVDFGDKDGDYVIKDLKHILDTRGQNWYTEIVLEGV